MTERPTQAVVKRARERVINRGAGSDGMTLLEPIDVDRLIEAARGDRDAELREMVAPLTMTADDDEWVHSGVPSEMTRERMMLRELDMLRTALAEARIRADREEADRIEGWRQATKWREQYEAELRKSARSR